MVDTVPALLLFLFPLAWSPGPGNMTFAANAARFGLVATVFTLNNALAFLGWSLAGDRLARLFQSPPAARRLNIALGTLLAAVAVWMLAA